MQHDITESMQLAASFMDRAQAAFLSFQHSSGQQRATLLEKVADGLEAKRASLVDTAMQESHLTAPRLNGELSRTTSQLRLFATLLQQGSWVQASIDPALPDRQSTATTDLRKMLRPKGPVVVFGASNFPFAFSTLGGDTASALAAGCPVVIKAHPGHQATSKAVFDAASEAISSLGFPPDILQHVDKAGNQIGIDLVQAKATAAVGFTGSFQAGNALMQAAATRPDPIEVFAEMSSTNPVVILPDLLTAAPENTAQKLAASVALGVGQFCTNPGLIFIIDGPGMEAFQLSLQDALNEVAPAEMLHQGVLEQYHNNLQIVLSQAGVDTLVLNEQTSDGLLTRPSIARVTADNFIHNTALKTEVFGPFSLLVVAKDHQELLSALRSLDGQLTASLFGTDGDLADLKALRPLLDSLTAIAGRVIFNEVPTGVQVSHAMMHGGPFPSTSNSSYTSVGASAILRWVRPVCYQNFPDNLLPDALKNSNPLGIFRQINGTWTKNKL